VFIQVRAVGRVPLDVGLVRLLRVGGGLAAGGGGARLEGTVGGAGRGDRIITRITRIKTAIIIIMMVVVVVVVSYASSPPLECIFGHILFSRRWDMVGIQLDTARYV